jgi:sugar phosphate isomerase/epimerase
MPPVSRRSFLRTGVATAAACAVQKSFAAEGKTFSTIGFTKPFQKASFERTAEIAVEVGWAGVEVPVRAKGQIEPTRVEEDLPRMVEVLKKRGITIDGLVTDILRTDSPEAEKILRTAKALGILRYRLGYWAYDSKASPVTKLAALKEPLKDLAAMNRSIGIRGGIQNHSGASRVGCAIWDIHELVRDLDPKDIGICFDLGHATVEGGLSWPVEARLMEPWLVCVYVKDFRWERGRNGFEPKWGPLGEGMIRKEFFDWLKESTYEGPIALYVEYLSGEGPEEVARMRKDQEALLKMLQA